MTSPSSPADAAVHVRRLIGLTDALSDRLETETRAFAEVQPIALGVPGSAHLRRRQSQGMEAVLQARRARQDVALLLPLVQQLNESAQAHQVRLSNLGPAWQVMYEFAAYQRTLLGLRGSLQAWQRALQVRSRTEARLFQQFEQRAWRTLGEGLLLVDMYEQGGHLHSDAPEPPSRPLWLQRLRQWLHG